MITTQLNDVTAGGGLIGFFGTFAPNPIAVAARSLGADGTSRAYVHHVSNSLQGNCNGVLAPDANNDLSRLSY